MCLAAWPTAKFIHEPTASIFENPKAGGAFKAGAANPQNLRFEYCVAGVVRQKVDRANAAVFIVGLYHEPKAEGAHEVRLRG